MREVNNPYARALDGLVLQDPVTSFFDFCKEREKIRIARESDKPDPWSDDPIFQQGRFLNVFREDDRGSKAIIKFAGDISEDLPTLIHALFFGRWCNRQETLDKLSPKILSKSALKITSFSNNEVARFSVLSLFFIIICFALSYCSSTSFVTSSSIIFALSSE